MRPRVAAYKKSAAGKAYTKDYKAKKPEVIAAGASRKREKRRQLYQAFKATPCADCGRTYPHYVMQFDHVKPGKIGCVATIKGGCKDRLLKEIAKCEVVCANCHAERTYKRAQEKKNGSTRIQVTRLPDGDIRPSG